MYSLYIYTKILFTCISVYLFILVFPQAFFPSIILALENWLLVKGTFFSYTYKELEAFFTFFFLFYCLLHKFCHYTKLCQTQFFFFISFTPTHCIIYIYIYIYIYFFMSILQPRETRAKSQRKKLQRIKCIFVYEQILVFYCKII